MAISLSNSTVAENVADGTVIGTLTGTGPFTLSDDASGRFEIFLSGSVYQLRVLSSIGLDYEGAVLHQHQITVVDGASASQSFTITLTDVSPEDVTGTASADTIIGGSGNDTLDGGDAADVLTGAAGNDSLTGGAGDDTISGGDGDDALIGGTGADQMTGGNGSDTYYVDDAGDSIVEVGTSGTDVLEFSGTFSTSLLPYELHASIENVIIDEAAGAAFVVGNGKVNHITGNSFANFIDAGTSLSAGDTILGGDGDDTYVVRNALALVDETANEGVDLVEAHVSYEITDADVENLTLMGIGSIDGTGNASVNTITGNAGGNRLDGAGGDDELIGGGGNDTYVLYTADTITITEDTSGGTDTVETDGDYVLGTNIERATVTDSVAGHQLTGNDLANVLTGNDGDDTLIGGAGRDTMIGGAGDDQYYVDNSLEIVTEVDGEGTLDTVTASVTYTLGANVENLVLEGGAGSINGTGNDLANDITGNEGDNLIDGMAGVDTMTGGAGDDTYVIDDETDSISEIAAEGTDTVRSSVTIGLADNVENLTLTGSGDIDGNDNSEVNVITGNAGKNVLSGVVAVYTRTGDLVEFGAAPTDDSAADTLDGGAGNDTYIVGAGDIVSEVSTTGTDKVYSIADFTLSTNIENLELLGAAISGTGNANANHIVGNTEANALDGKGGADTMWGGDGEDTYYVDNADDIAMNVDFDGVTATTGADWVFTENLSIDLTDTTHFSGISNVSLGSGNSGLSATGDEFDNELLGNAGNNLLNAGAGTDALTGGDGDDTYVLDAADADTVTENDGEGTDVVQVDSDYTLTDFFENLTLTGTGDFAGTGNTLANVLTGNDGANVLDGLTGADSMFGGDGNDTYYVDDSGDRMTENVDEGTADKVFSTATTSLGANVEELELTGAADVNGVGNELANVMTGNDGNNVLNGAGGIDDMHGGLGDDTFVMDASADVVDGGDGTDLVRSGAQSIDLSDAARYTDVEDATITGTTAFDLKGTTGVNTLTGGGGANLLDGNGGDDSMYGGGGNDTYVVDSVGDTIAEAGNGVVAGGTDTVIAKIDAVELGADMEKLELFEDAAVLEGIGNTANNTITGNTNANVIRGGNGADTMLGGQGDDSYYVDNKLDRVTELDIGADSLAGADTVVSSATSWTMSANVDNIELAAGTTRRDAFGNAMANTMTGNNAANLLNGYGGADTMNGGAGNDTFVVNDSDVVDGGDGIDLVQSSLQDVDFSDTALYTNAENITLLNLTASTANNLAATGTGDANKIVGNLGDNVIDGGAGDDTMQGGKGSDTYKVDASGDRISEYLNQGTADEVEATGSAGFTSYTLTANVENLTMLGTLVTGKGNGLANSIVGNIEANVIDGMGGNDTMEGGDGDDTYVVSQAVDVVTEVDVVTSATSGTDLVQSFVSGYTLAANVENLTLMSLVATGTGNILDNTIRGNNAANLIDGGAGIDEMIGGLGNDTYVVDDVDDVVTEAASQGFDTIRSSVTYTASANVEVLQLMTGAGDIDGTGNSLANRLFGNDGVNNLLGEDGADILDGGLDADILSGGAGADVFKFTSSDVLTVSDEITDFVAADDVIQLSKAVFAGFSATGTLAAANFVTGDGAVSGDAADRIIYDTTSGKLMYDADGSGSTTAVEIAQLSTGLTLTNADIVIIA